MQKDDDNLDVRQKLFSIVIPAIDQLGKVIRGEQSFSSNCQLRACVAMARLAPLLFSPAAAAEPAEERLAHPAHSDEEVERLLNILEGKEEPKSDVIKS